MKLIFAILLLSLSTLILAQNKPDKYEAYLQSIQREIGQMGMQINVNNPNPFITGSSLQNYFLNEKILLLERDAYFMMKSNKLETTEQVADYQHRLKVLRSHASNMLLHLVRALQNASQDGFGSRTEAAKQQIQWEELLEQCKKSTECVTRRLASGEVVIQNDVVDSLAFSLQLFKQVPYMHAIEFASIFQLVQLLHMEIMLGYSRVSKVEFDLFITKQKKLAKELEQNKQLTPKEKQYHRTLISNTVNKWKKKILERKFDQKERFIELTKKMKTENKNLLAQIDKTRLETPDISPIPEVCRGYIPFKKDRRRCNLRAKLEAHIQNIRENGETFTNTKEKKLPKDFFETI